MRSAQVQKKPLQATIGGDERRVGYDCSLMAAVGLASRSRSEPIEERPYVFPPFRLDPAERCVWHGLERRPLTYKAFCVLTFLIQNTGRIVSKEELLETVWRDTFVGDAVLKVCIAEIRKALRDTPKDPQYIQTFHRHGYRFIGRTVQDHGQETRPLEREGVLGQLRDALKSAQGGKRQIAFLTGEAGIGKSTVVEAFLADAGRSESIRIAQAQCLDQNGLGETYFPLLEALGSLTRQMDCDLLTRLLRQHAPTWLAELPSLTPAADREALHRETIGAAKDRMLREFGALIEALCEEIPLVLVIEDLHWSDFSTVDAIAYLARRRQACRLVLVATYRPDEVILRQHPLKKLKQELLLHGYCLELPLELLTVNGVTKYMQARFSGCAWAPMLAGLIHQRTDGNPLLVVNVIDQLVSKAVIVSCRGSWALSVPAREIAVDIPESVQEMIERWVACCPPEEHALLQAASIVGPEFSTGILAAALGGEADLIRIEECCQGLVRRRQWLVSVEPAENTFRFIHELYQEALRRTLVAGERIKLHIRIAGFLETSGGAAAELAVHWAEGREYRRAVPYLIDCARISARRHATREAMAHLHRAWCLLRKAPLETRMALEGTILEQRGLLLRSMDDLNGAVADFERLVRVARTQECRELEVRALLRLSAVLFWSDPGRCLEAAGRAVELSRLIGNPVLHAHAAGYLGSRILRLKGWSEADFHRCVLAVEAARRSGAQDFLGLHLMSLANFHSSQANYDQASAAADEGMELALQAGDAYHFISCQYFKAWALLHAGCWGETLALIRDGCRLSESNGHQTAATYCRVLEAWLHLEAFDYERADQLAGVTLANSSRGLVRTLALIVAARTATALGDLNRAASFLAEVRSHGAAMDWAYNFPLLQAAGELCLARGDWDGARAAAIALEGLADTSRQTTYRTIAKAIRMEAALADPRGEFQKDIAPLETLDSPLSGWRLHVVAARTAGSEGRQEAAARHCSLGVAALEALAESLGNHPLAACVRRKMKTL